MKDEAGNEIDLVNASSKSTTTDLKHLNESIADTGGQGVLMEGAMMCPKCDSQKVYVVMMQTRSSDEPETKIGTCVQIAGISSEIMLNCTRFPEF